ncbi:helix-turn-helix transcriptional regulator [Terribacillus saccharophilus]|uniref:helix-turn-helix transcriptional regulator n=1 Tax=Terribacillus saccharophilus TaxID=361277 RepID=UPI000BA6CC4E|nr:helix-turn-helix transcriptional regulator [Terribacillus saccharophilus]PAF15922.1 transcriptional regulator [Terribacillus saccharophilus]
MNRTQIGKNLLNLRGDESRATIAKALEISESALAMYETGKRIPKDDIKIRIAKHYNKTVQELFFEVKLHETSSYTA